MNIYLQKAIKDEIIEKTELKNTIKLSKKSFKNTYNEKIEDLEFLYVDDGFDYVGIFKIREDIFVYHMDENIWSKISYVLLNVQNSIVMNNKIKLIDNSFDEIEYILYNFITDKDELFSVNEDYLVDMSCAKELVCEIKDNVYSFDWNNEFKLQINQYDGTYIITKNNNFLSGFTDIGANFQLGDCCTNVYLLTDGDIVISNNGDVPSVIIVRFRK